MDKRFWFYISSQRRDGTPIKALVMRPALPEYRALAEQYGYRAYDPPSDPEKREQFDSAVAHFSTDCIREVDVARLRTMIVDQHPPYYNWVSLEELMPVPVLS